MRAAVLESRPLIGLGIQQVLHRIAEVDHARIVSPGRGVSLDGTDLLVVGDMLQGYDPAMLELLGTATDVRGVLYLCAGGAVQWLPPHQVSPLLSWLPPHAPANAIEETLREMIGALRSGCCTGTLQREAPVGAEHPARWIANESAIVLPMAEPSHVKGIPLPEYMTEARMLGLTQRQYDVLVLLSQGYPIKLISRHMHISVPTVKSHTLQIYRRLAARNKTEAVFVAREKGAALASASAAAEAA